MPVSQSQAEAQATQSKEPLASDSVPIQPILPPTKDNTSAHIALLLPLNSSNSYIRQAAEAIQKGFLAASIVQPISLPIRVYSCADEGKEVTALYQNAVTNGASAVIGPITRAGAFNVISIAKNSSVPTLILNNPDKPTTENNLYYFGMTLESEARQVARLAKKDDLTVASIVSTDTPLSKRLVQAFSEEWKSGGGKLAVVKIVTDEAPDFSDIIFEPGSMVFIAATADKARVFRPYLNALLPVYSTSQIFNGNADKIVNYDLREVNFVDMPWVLQPDHSAVMIYPRPDLQPSIDMERLYALAIDSYRLLQLILTDRLSSLPLDGVTGTIRLNASHQFEREALSALFRRGAGVPNDGSVGFNSKDGK